MIDTAALFDTRRGISGPVGGGNSFAIVWPYGEHTGSQMLKGNIMALHSASKERLSRLFFSCYSRPNLQLGS